MTNIKTNFIFYMGLVSITGFFVIMLDSFTGVDLSEWITAAIFIIIGIGLAFIGGIFSIIKYLESGLTNEEIAFILMSLIGILAIIVGVLELPINFLSNIDIPAFSGVKGIVALFAIIIISIQVYQEVRE